MSDLLEILLVAFCGLVLVFAILFIGCWCVIACAFYCLKHFYNKTVNLDSMVSAMTLTSTSSDGASLDSGSDIESRVYASHGAQGYLESLETGSAAVAESNSHYQALARMETGISRNLPLRGNESSAAAHTIGDLRKVKVACEDIPPQYETLSPPTYESLFPEDQSTMVPYLAKVNHENEKKMGNPG